MIRVVFDTNAVISALVFRGSLAWLVDHWQGGKVRPLVSRETAAEFMRVLAYPKFGLSLEKIDVIAARYVPFADRLEKVSSLPNLPQCRDPKDQMFLDLATTGQADILVTGDPDLLVLDSDVAFVIETPEDYRRRWLGE